MIEALLPRDVVAVETSHDDPAASLLPSERAVIAHAPPTRRAEFTTVRHCARAALARLGVAAAPIVPGDRGEPSWPVGVVGSLTHCAGYRAAAVARTSTVAALGIDAEPHQPLPEGVLALVSVPAERRTLTALNATDASTHWDRVLFSAKESVYKAWFPRTRQRLGFADAAVAIDAHGGTFTARLHQTGLVVSGRPLTHLTGAWQVSAGLVITAMVVRRVPLACPA